MSNPLTPAQATLAAKHGTPDAFAEAAYRAVPGEISLAEAEAAIRGYNAEWKAASSPCALTCLLEPRCFVRVDDGTDEGFLWIYFHDRLDIRVELLREGAARYCIELERGFGRGRSIQEAAGEIVRRAHEVLLRHLDSDSLDHSGNAASLEMHIERLSILHALMSFKDT